MTSEEMRKAWIETSRRLDSIENKLNGGSRYENNFNSRQTSLDRLKRTYKIFAIIALCMLPCLNAFSRMDEMIPGMKTWIVAMAGIYFLMVAVMDFWLHCKISEIDVYRMPVREVAERARRCKKKHHQFQCVLIPYAIIFFILLVYSLQGNKFIIAGCCTGGAVGLAIGTKKYLEMMRDYKNLSYDDEISSDVEDETEK